jgi:hypothetical protein
MKITSFTKPLWITGLGLALGLILMPVLSDDAFAGKGCSPRCRRERAERRAADVRQFINENAAIVDSAIDEFENANKLTCTLDNSRDTLNHGIAVLSLEQTWSAQFYCGHPNGDLGAILKLELRKKKDQPVRVYKLKPRMYNQTPAPAPCAHCSR